MEGSRQMTFLVIIQVVAEKSACHSDFVPPFVGFGKIPHPSRNDFYLGSSGYALLFCSGNDGFAFAVAGAVLVEPVEDANAVLSI